MTTVITTYDRVQTTITADDGRELAATWFEPTGSADDAAVGAVLLAPAMATPAAYYAAFATWLASPTATAP